MKVNLVERNFDLNELLYEIHLFEMFSAFSPNYIVMNEETAEHIGNIYRVHYVEDGVCFKHNKRYVNKFFGIPIAYNHNLPFGTVDIV